MIRRKKHNKNVNLPMDREEKLVKGVWDDVAEMMMSLQELEGDEEVIEHIADGIHELADLIEAIAYQGQLPEKLKRPWRVKEMS